MKKTVIYYYVKKMKNNSDVKLLKSRLQKIQKISTAFMEVKPNDLENLLQIYTNMYYKDSSTKQQRERALQMRETVKLYIATRESLEKSLSIHKKITDPGLY